MGTPMAAYDWLRYANQGATRNQPLSDSLIAALEKFAPEMGLTVEVFSGGQPGKGSGLARIGSVRHDHGNAADVFFSKDGRRLNWANPSDMPIFEDIVKRARAAGLTGFGAGPGYMQPGSMHIGFGAPGVWGAGGRGANAPEWLRQAYEGGRAAPLMAMADVKSGSFDPIAEVLTKQAQPEFTGPLPADQIPVPATGFGQANAPMASGGVDPARFGGMAVPFTPDTSVKKYMPGAVAAQEASPPQLPGTLAPMLGSTEIDPPQPPMPMQGPPMQAPAQGPASMLALANLFGSMGTEQPQFSPVQIRGPSPEQATALTSFIEALKKRVV